MQELHRGKQSVVFPNFPAIEANAAIVGKKEGEGPLREDFDQITQDTKLNQASWEKPRASFRRPRSSWRSGKHRSTMTIWTFYLPEIFSTSASARALPSVTRRFRFSGSTAHARRWQSLFCLRRAL